MACLYNGCMSAKTHAPTVHAPPTRTRRSAPAARPPREAARPPQVLKHLRIVSLALNLPGPAALMRLHAMGARCTKIEPPAGDPMARYSPQAYADLHEGVKVQTLDLKTEPGCTALDKLLATTDVLLTSFRPSALQRLGLDASALAQRLPALCSVRIVGDAGERAELPGHDLTYLAEQGLITGTDLPATLYADMAGSQQAVEAVLQCALHRAATPAQAPAHGLHLTVGLAQAAAYLALPRRWALTAPRAVIGGAHAGYQVYACRDGRVAIAALEPHFGACLCKAVGLPVEAGEITRALTQPAARQHIANFMAGLSRTEVEKLARLYDLPLHVLGD